MASKTAPTETNNPSGAATTINLPADLTFEKALAELEAITERLEQGRESLETSMQLYEQGLALKEFCDRKLKEAESKWLILKKQKNGSVVEEEIPNDRIPEPNELQGQMF
jgi:exodeoxyribonuclease VII small subunit